MARTGARWRPPCWVSRPSMASTPIPRRRGPARELLAARRDGFTAATFPGPDRDQCRLHPDPAGVSTRRVVAPCRRPGTGVASLEGQMINLPHRSRQRAGRAAATGGHETRIKGPSLRLRPRKVKCRRWLLRPGRGTVPFGSDVNLITAVHRPSSRGPAATFDGGVLEILLPEAMVQAWCASEQSRSAEGSRKGPCGSRSRRISLVLRRTDEDESDNFPTPRAARRFGKRAAGGAVIAESRAPAGPGADVDGSIWALHAHQVVNAAAVPACPHPHAAGRAAGTGCVKDGRQSGALP